VRAHPHLAGLLLALAGDPGVDEVLGEHVVALEQELV
jgi:hypothetical protein